MKRIFNILVLLMLAMTVSAEKLPYKDSSLTPQERAKDLLGRMTLDEKIMQLQCVWGDNKKVVFPDGKFDAKLAKEYFPNGLGEMVRPNEYLGPDIKQNHQAYPALQGAEQYNAIQKYFVEQTRLGIPVVMHDEGVHGVWTQEATNYPVSIALASTWDLKLIRQVFAATALEMRSRGAYQSLGPVLDMVRDGRRRFPRRRCHNEYSSRLPHRSHERRA